MVGHCLVKESVLDLGELFCRYAAEVGLKDN